jgi:hypothetical protein
MAKQNEAKFFFPFRFEAKNSKRNEAKTSEKIGLLFSLEQAKTKRNESCFALFRFEAKKFFKQNRRTLTEDNVKKLKMRHHFRVGYSNNFANMRIRIFETS